MIYRGKGNNNHTEIQNLSRKLTAILIQDSGGWLTVTRTKEHNLNFRNTA
jgi:hypothetical protein